jgi:predicted amidophosphoribosyltransferase
MARGVGDSVGLDAAGRSANLAGRVRTRPGGLPVEGTPVVLLDDVVTTGTTAAICTAVLAAASVEVTAVAVLTSAGDR